MAFTVPSFRVSNGALLTSALTSATARESETIALIVLERSGTVTMAPTGTSEEVKYERVGATFCRVRGMTVMRFMGYL